jgi:hypothetical protein
MIEPTRRAEKIRKRLGWELGILNDKEGKPKGMRWRTYHQLEDEYDDEVTLAFAGVLAKFGMLRDFFTC